MATFVWKGRTLAGEAQAQALRTSDPQSKDALIEIARSYERIDAQEANFAENHTVVSFFAPELNRWRFVDPFLGVMGRDSAGSYLSTQDVHARTNPPIVFFGNPSQVHSLDDKRCCR